MKVLIDIGHPAHVHLFKNLIFYFKKKGYKVIVASREKDITTYLLNHYKISHIMLSKAQSGFLGALFEFLQRTIKIIKLQQKHNFDIAIGTSVSINYLSLFFKVKSYVFCEDDDNVVPLFVLLAYPFATKIINPDCLKYKVFKSKRVLHNSYQKLAYLHPNNFKPDLKILKKYKLQPYRYIIIRKSALKAHHDTNVKGLEELFPKIDSLQLKYTLIKSFEKNKKNNIRPEHMHDVLAFAKLLITDSQSMAVESSVLGTPSIRYNSFGKKISILKELEDRYKLTYSFVPGEEKKAMLKIKNLLKSKDLESKWRKKKEMMFQEKTDLNQWMIKFFNKEIKTI